MADAELVTIVGGVKAPLAKAEDAPHVSGDMGILALAVRNDNAATVLSSANSDNSASAVDSRGATFVTDAPMATAGTAIAFALGANTPTQILAVNAARKLAIVTNDSGQTVMLRIGAAVTTSLYSISIPTGQRFELRGPTGLISAVSVLAGAAVAPGVGLFVTEFTQ